MDFDRYKIFERYGYKYGTFIQYLIDYAELAIFDMMNNKGAANPNLNWIPEKKTEGRWSSPTQQDILNHTRISFPLQRVICNKLKKSDILKIKRKGVPARNWYKLNLSKIYDR